MNYPAKQSGAVKKDKFLSPLSDVKIRNLTHATAQISQEKANRILNFLKNLPSLEFSQKGVANIINRFDISPDQLAYLIDIVILKAR